MHRFFVPPSTITNQAFASHDPELCHQFFRVLKLKPGEQIMLCDNTEHEYLVELTGVSKSEVAGKILEKKLKPDIGGNLELHLFVPPLKNPSLWEWMVEKCTEIGVASFTPLLTERTEVKTLRKIDRLQRIIREAAELSGRTTLPVIHEPIEFKEFLVRNSKFVIRDSISFIATVVKIRDPSTAPLSISKLGSARDDAPRRITYNLQANSYNLLLGPVGDFTEHEVRLAIEHGFQPISLGSQILRTETAAVVGATVILLNFKNILK